MQPSTSGSQLRRSERTVNRRSTSVSADKNHRQPPAQREYVISSSEDDEDELGQKIDRRQLIQDVAHYFLASSSNTNRGYGKEIELRKLFINTGGKEFRESVINEAKMKVEDLLGIKVHYDREGQRFFLTKRGIIPMNFNELDYVERSEGEAINDETEKYKDGLLLAALTFIFMTKRHAVKEEPGIDVKLLQSFLAGVDEGVTEDIFRAFFGPTRTAEFLAQGWLTCTVNRNLSGVEDIQYDWGPRAEATVEKKKILKYFCDIYGSEMDKWPRHVMKMRERRI